MDDGGGIEFEEWYRREHPRLIGSLAALSGRDDVAAEAADEAFARALARWPRVSKMASPGGWTYRVALNELRRRLRRSATERHGRSTGWPARAEVDDHPLDDDVWRAVRALPDRQRTAIVLRYVADLPEADIAEAMHVSRGTVASNLSDARKALARFLGDDEIGTGRAHGGLPMNELERAATALLDRPVGATGAAEAIERRAATLRRRRRVLEAGAIALVLLLLGTAGLALSAVRSDDDQGVFVGEGPATAPTSSVVTYRLGSPVDDATAEALKQTIEARFRWFGQADAVVRVHGSEVTVSTQAPADRIDALVTSPGGFQLRAVVAQVDAALCDSGAHDDALWTSALTGHRPASPCAGDRCCRATTTAGDPDWFGRPDRPARDPG